MTGQFTFLTLWVVDADGDDLILDITDPVGVPWLDPGQTDTVELNGREIWTKQSKVESAPELDGQVVTARVTDGQAVRTVRWILELPE